MAGSRSELRDPEAVIVDGSFRGAASLYATVSCRQVVFLTIFSMLPILAMLNFQCRIRNDVSQMVPPDSLILSYPSSCYPVMCVGAQESKASSMIYSIRTKTILLHFERPFTASSKTCFPHIYHVGTHHLLHLVIWNHSKDRWR